MLKSVARSPFSEDMGKENPKLESVLQTIKLTNPKVFLTDDDLPKRRFFHKPSIQTPYLSFEKDKV